MTPFSVGIMSLLSSGTCERCHINQTKLLLFKQQLLVSEPNTLLLWSCKSLNTQSHNHKRSFELINNSVILTVRTVRRQFKGRGDLLGENMRWRKSVEEGLGKCGGWKKGKGWRIELQIEGREEGNNDMNGRKRGETEECREEKRVRQRLTVFWPLATAMLSCCLSD